MSVCSSDGNQGFPVVLEGSINSTEDVAFKSIQAEPEIYSAFSFSRTFPQLTKQLENETQNDRRNIIQLPDMDMNTLNYKGGTYTLKHIQICKKTRSGSWPTAPKGTYNAECVFSFRGTSGITNALPSSIIIIVPLYEKESMAYEYDVSKKPLMYFSDLVASYEERPAVPRVESLSQIFSEFGNPGYVLYSSCLNLKINQNTLKTTNILGLYFPFGWILPTDLIKLLGDYSYRNLNDYGNFFIPSALREQGAPVAKRAPTSTSAPAIQAYIEDRNTQNLNFSTNGETYPQLISPSRSEFTKRMLYVKRGLIGVSEMNQGNRLKTTFEYQCLPLDKVRDINGTNVLLDPNTGKRSLHDTLKGTEEQQIDLDITKKAVETGAVEKFAITAGVIFALILIILVFSFAVRYIMGRNRQGLRPDNLAQVESLGTT